MEQTLFIEQATKGYVKGNKVCALYKNLWDEESFARL